MAGPPGPGGEKVPVALLDMVAAWDDASPNQADFVDIKDVHLGPGDVMESLDADGKNDLLRRNQQVLEVTMMIFTKYDKVFTLEELQQAVALKYDKPAASEVVEGQEMPSPRQPFNPKLAHSQASALKSMAQILIREAKKTRNSHKPWLKGLKEKHVIGDNLLVKKFVRGSGKKKDQAPKPESGLAPHEGPAPSSLEFVLGVVSAKHPDFDHRLQYKKRFKAYLRDRESAGADVQPLPEDAEAGAGDANPEEGAEDAVDGCDDGGNAEDESADEGDGKGKAEEEAEAKGPEEEPKKKRKGPQNGPLYQAYREFLRRAKDMGVRHSEAMQLWKHSVVRAALVDGLGPEERKRRRLA